MFGNKDHTWTDVIFMDPDIYEKYEKISKKHLDLIGRKEENEQ
jgi:hypothetical protein